MDALPFNNPVAWAHFKVRGGWRSHLFGAGGYLLVIVGIIAVTTRLSVTGAAGALLGWTSALLGLQLAVLVLFGCSVVGNSVRRDISGGLLESHRLMPVSSASAVLGYVVGPSFQATLIAAINLALGTITSSLSGGVPAGKWFLANAIIALFVVFLWVAVTFASFVAKNAFAMLFGLLISTLVPAMASGGNVLANIPALSVLADPLIGVFTLYNRGGDVTRGILWALAAQLVFGTIFFRGAMRRYRRDDVPALGTTLGLLLLTAWIATSVVGILQWNNDPAAPRWRRGSGVREPSVQVITTLITAMLIGLVPVAGAGRAMTDWMRTLLSTGRRPAGRPLPPPLVACCAAAIALPVICTAPPRLLSPGLDVDALFRAGVMLLAFFLSMSYLLRIFYRAGRKAAVVGGVWLIATWLLPLGLDAFRITALARDSSSYFSLASPLGTLIDLWSDRPTEGFVGLGFQVLLAIIAAVAFYATEPTRAGARGFQIVVGSAGMTKAPVTPGSEP